MDSNCPFIDDLPLIYLLNIMIVHSQKECITMYNHVEPLIILGLKIIKISTYGSYDQQSGVATVALGLGAQVPFPDPPRSG